MLDVFYVLEYEVCVPKRYWQAKLNDKNTVVRKVKTLKDGSGLLLAGANGCGKTYALCAYLIEKITDPQNMEKASNDYSKISGYYIDANELYSKLKKEPEFIEKMKEVSILCIDDLGVEYEAETGFFHSLLDGIVNYRYNSFLTTIIATNLPLEIFAKRYSGRIVDRLREWGSFFESKESSYRGAERK